MQALLPLSYGMLGKKCWDRAKGMRTASSSGNNYSNITKDQQTTKKQPAINGYQTTTGNQAALYTLYKRDTKTCRRQECHKDGRPHARLHLQTSA